MITLLTFFGLGGLAPLLAAAGGWLTIIGGPVAGIAGLFAKQLSGGTVKLILIGIAVLAAVIAIVGFAAHYEHLKNAAAELAELQPKIAALETAFDCPQRPADERDLFACIPARDRDIEVAKAAEIQRQHEIYARELDAQQKRADDAEADLEFANRLINSADAADDGPLPKVMRDNWARERVKRGVK